MTDEKIRRARAALAAYEKRRDDLNLPTPEPKALQELADALRAFLPEMAYDVWEIVSASGCREEHKAVTTGLTKEDAQNYIAKVDPAARRHLYVRERAR